MNEKLEKIKECRHLLKRLRPGSEIEAQIFYKLIELTESLLKIAEKEKENEIF